MDVVLYIVSGVLIITVVVLLFVLFNCLKKIEFYEGQTAELNEEVERLTGIAFHVLQKNAEAIKKIQALDRRGAFASDDEVGVIFKNIKEVVEKLNEGVEILDE